MCVHDDRDEGLSLPIVFLAQNSGWSMDILDHLIYLHTISMDNETLRAVWFYSTSGPKHSDKPDYGTWQPFYKEHNKQLEDAFGLSTKSIIELQHPHPDGFPKLFVSITEPLVSFIQKPNGHYVSLHTVMRALVPANFQLMPVPENGSEKKDTDTPETPCI